MVFILSFFLLLQGLKAEGDFFRQAKKEGRVRTKETRVLFRDKELSMEEGQNFIDKNCRQVIKDDFFDKVVADLAVLTRLKLEETSHKLLEQNTREKEINGLSQKELIDEIRDRDNGIDGRIKQAQLDLIKIVNRCSFYTEGIMKVQSDYLKAGKIIIDGTKNISKETLEKVNEVFETKIEE